LLQLDIWCAALLIRGLLNAELVDRLQCILGALLKRESSSERKYQQFLIEITT